MANWKETKAWLTHLQDKRVMIACHRGKSSCSVIENTALAFQIAAGQGADMVEMDLDRTKDGVLVGHHDRYMHRLFKLPEKRICDFFYKELMELPLYNYFSEIGPEKLNTFDEILTALKDKTILVIDRAWDYLDEVRERLIDHDMLDQAIIKFNIGNEDACQWAETHPDCVYIPMVREVSAFERVLEMKRHCPVVGIEILPQKESDEIFQPSTVEWLHEQGLRVWCNSLSYASRLVFGAGNDDLKSMYQGGDAGWGKLVKQGVDIIQTDWPFEVRQYLIKMGKTTGL